MAASGNMELLHLFATKQQREHWLMYAPLAEMMGRLPWCSEVFNCSRHRGGAARE